MPAGIQSPIHCAVPRSTRQCRRLSGIGRDARGNSREGRGENAGFHPASFRSISGHERRANSRRAHSSFRRQNRERTRGTKAANRHRARFRPRRTCGQGRQPHRARLCRPPRFPAVDRAGARGPADHRRAGWRARDRAERPQAFLRDQRGRAAQNHGAHDARRGGGDSFSLECGRQPSHAHQGQRAHAHLRSHQFPRAQPSGRPERREHRPALRARRRCMGSGPARHDEGDGGARGHHAARGRLRCVPRAVI